MRPLLVTSGEPAGIGPDICLQLSNVGVPVVVMGDKHLLRARAEQVGISLILAEYGVDTYETNRDSTLWVMHCPVYAPVVPGVLNAKNALYVVDMLEKATALCLSKEFAGIVTAPVHKAVINEAGIVFSGHTEFFAKQCSVDKVVMMLACDEMKVALVTTHLPLSKVPSAITRSNVEQSIRILYAGIQQYYGIKKPKIYIAGLNPHAGENGYLGTEEQTIITPVIERLKCNEWELVGPLPADTMFSPENDKRCDAYLAMYHDQGLAVIKHAAFGRAVNVTLGLPIIRTSVDHGTALSLAGTGKACAQSIQNAVRHAWELAQIKRAYADA